MADPNFIDLPADVWTPIAIGITSGIFTMIEINPNKHLYARRDTGGSAPVNISDGSPVFIGKIREEFSARVSSDVYMRPIGAVGRVEVDT